jgi:hypothetical protein
VIGRDDTVWILAGVFFYDTHSERPVECRPCQSARR